MALFDIFKKKKEKPKKKIEKKIEKKEIKEKPVEKKQPVPVPPAAEPRREKKISDRAYKILHSPHVTEKVTDLEKENKYVFKVWSKANKVEIKKAIEETYGVDVEGVRIINIHRRKRRLGRQIGWKKGYKKAIVKVKKGQKIEILSR